MTIVAGSLIRTVSDTYSGERKMPMRASPTDVQAAFYVRPSTDALVVSGPVRVGSHPSWPHACATDMYLLLCCGMLGWTSMSWIDHVLLLPGE